MAGAVAIVVMVLSAYWKPSTWNMNPRLALALLFVLVLAFASLTFHRGSFYVNGISFYQQWVKTNPSNPSAQNGLGCRLWEQGRFQEAIHHIQLSIKYCPTEAYPYQNLALLYFEDLKQYDAANWYVDKAIAIDTKHIIIDAYRLKADILLTQGRAQEAQGWFLKYLELSPDDIDALYKTAVISEQTQNIAKAMRYYQRVLALDPSYEDAGERYRRLASDSQ
jgi:tetratricopeptide (TPR) repeat protein